MFGYKDGSTQAGMKVPPVSFIKLFIQNFISNIFKMCLVPFIFKTMEREVLTKSRKEISRAYIVLALPCMSYFYRGNLTGRINMNIHLCLYDLLAEYILKTVKQKLVTLLKCLQLLKFQV